MTGRESTTVEQRLALLVVFASFTASASYPGLGGWTHEIQKKSGTRASKFRSPVMARNRLHNRLKSSCQRLCGYYALSDATMELDEMHELFKTVPSDAKPENFVLYWPPYDSDEKKRLIPFDKHPLHCSENYVHYEFLDILTRQLLRKRRPESPPNGEPLASSKTQCVRVADPRIIISHWANHKSDSSDFTGLESLYSQEMFRDQFVDQATHYLNLLLTPSTVLFALDIHGGARLTLKECPSEGEPHRLIFTNGSLKLGERSKFLGLTLQMPSQTEELSMDYDSLVVNRPNRPHLDLLHLGHAHQTCRLVTRSALTITFPNTLDCSLLLRVSNVSTCFVEFDGQAKLNYAQQINRKFISSY